MIREKLQKIQVKRLVVLNLPYFFIFYVADKGSWLYRHCLGESMVQRLGVMLVNFRLAFLSWLPSIALQDLTVGVLVAGALKLVVYYRSKNAKKFRQGVEYGSARWGNRKDIEPFMDPVFENNVILTETERLTMNSRPKAPKYARNKNVIVIGGSGSGKTRFYVKPNLMQMTDHVSYVVTDPKGTIIVECGKMLVNGGYRIKVLNTINFKKSMHYNRATCSPLKRRRTALFQSVLRPVVAAAAHMAEETGEPAMAIQLVDGTMVTGKTSELIGFSAAALLNALKYLSGAGGHGIHLIAQSAIEPIQTVKVKHLGSANPRLHSDEVLIALASSANADPKAARALDHLEELGGCQAHCTVILSPADAVTYKKLGLQLTCEPQYQTNKLYHR